RAGVVGRDRGGVDPEVEQGGMYPPSPSRRQEAVHQRAARPLERTHQRAVKENQICHREGCGSPISGRQPAATTAGRTSTSTYGTPRLFIYLGSDRGSPIMELG